MSQKIKTALCFVSDEELAGSTYMYPNASNTSKYQVFDGTELFIARTDSNRVRLPVCITTLPESAPFYAFMLTLLELVRVHTKDITENNLIQIVLVVSSSIAVCHNQARFCLFVEVKQ